MDIPPLRKRTRKGVPYTRPPEIEELIVESLSHPFEEFLARAQINDRKHPEYLPSEVLVHRIRATRHAETDEQFNALYPVLLQRIYRSCPNVSTRAKGRGASVGKLLDVREEVFHRFVTLLLKDRDGYEEKMDFFEIRFDRTVMLIRNSAFRKIEPREKPLNPIEYDQRGEIPKDVEVHFSLMNPRPMTLDEELTYRFQIRPAINLLPEAERRVIYMLEAKVPIESKNPNQPSIAGVLGCTPKTVRNRRDRAIQRLQEMLGLEGSDAD